MTWFATGAAVVSGGLQIAGGIKGKKAAKSAGKAQAAAIMTEWREQDRRLKKDMKATQSFTELAVAASNLQMEGTPKTYLDEMKGEQQRQLDFLKKSAQSQARTARKGGAAAGTQAMYQGIAGGLQSFGQAASFKAGAK